MSTLVILIPHPQSDEEIARWETEQPPAFAVGHYVWCAPLTDLSRGYRIHQVRHYHHPQSTAIWLTVEEQDMPQRAPP